MSRQHEAATGITRVLRLGGLRSQAGTTDLQVMGLQMGLPPCGAEEKQPLLLLVRSEHVGHMSDGERRRCAVTGEPIARPALEIAAPYRSPCLPAERQEEMYIVQGE